MISSTMREDFSLIADGIGETIEALANTKHIYITGATGQIGWYLTRFFCFLISSGRLNCKLTVHARSQTRVDEKFSDQTSLPCDFLVSDDAAAFLKDTSVDLLIHCASLASPKHFASTPVDVMIPNGIMSHNLLDRLAKFHPQCKFVYLSTTGVTGHIPDEQRPCDEEHYGPLSSSELKNCYLESKRFGEMLTLAYSQQFNIPSLIVRPSITYGPGFDLNDGRSYADFIQSLLQKRAIKLSSNGRAIRNFLYISDFVRGLLTAICKAPTRSVMNIASDQPISILELATLLNNQIYPFPLGEVERVEHAEPLRRVEFLSTDASVDRLKALGWSQLITPLEGFRRTLRHYQEIAQ